MTFPPLETNANIQVPIFIFDKIPDLLVQPLTSIVSSKSGEIGTIGVIQTGAILFQNTKAGWAAIVSPERMFELINDRIRQNGIPL